jgi:aspartate 1-decarboxylase
MPNWSSKIADYDGDEEEDDEEEAEEVTEEDAEKGGTTLDDEEMTECKLTEFLLVSPLNEKTGKRVVTFEIDGKIIALDRVDTNCAIARKRFLKPVWEHMDLTEAEVRILESAMIKKAAEADAAEAAEIAAEQEARKLAGPRSEEFEDSPEAKEAAAKFLKNPKLFDELHKDFQAIGIVGEQQLATICYLIGTSRKLPDPLGGIVQAASSSGKSYVCKKIVQMMPPEDVLEATDVTPQALYYLTPGSLEHCFVYIGERPHAQDGEEVANATIALRELLSGKELSKLVTISGDKGMRSERIYQKGPISFLQTTTELQIADEDANRLLELSTDESHEQTKRIVEFQKDRAERGEADNAEIESVLAKHHAAQRMLDEVNVRIPYAKFLDVSSSRVLARRGITHLLSTITVVAFLRQYQRKDVEEGTIEATVEDYDIAFNLLQPIMERLYAPLSESALKLLDKLFAAAEAANEMPQTYRFTCEVCVKLTGISLTGVRNRLKALEGAGCITRQDDARPGTAIIYRIVPGNFKSSGSSAGLVTPAELRKRLAIKDPAAAEGQNEAIRRAFYPPSDENKREVSGKGSRRSKR